MGPGRSQTIFLLVNDASIGDVLVRACQAQGFKPMIGATVPEIGSRLVDSPPAPVIIHTAALPPDKDLSEVLGYFAWVAERRVQTLILATEDDLRMRLAARRAGCIGFHVLPISDREFADILAPFSGDDKGPQERILVVDDVKVEAMISGQILRKAGYEVLELCNELEIMNTIRSFQPDLILMDLNMPNASGSELTAIIRDHADMLLTPIVFLSGEQDAAAKREAMRLGADEFLSKPVSPQNLIGTVRARIKRSRGIQRRFAPADETDQATGLMSRRGFVRRLDERLAESSPGPGDGVLFVCVDDMGRLIKEAGIGGEDRLLAAIGTTIRTLLHGSDIAARFGQHSFTVLAARADTNALVEFAHELQRQLQNPPLGGSQQPAISLSIGLAQLADQTDALTQISRSESACWQARGAKPGQVSVYGAAKPAETSSQIPPEQTELNETTPGLKPEIRYAPLLALSARVRPARRYRVSASLPNDAQAAPDTTTLTPGPTTEPATEPDTSDSDRAHWLDYQSMERALDQLAADRNKHGTAQDTLPLRLFVPQSVATVIHREWVLWMRDRLLERHLVAYAPIVVLRADDLVAHLGVANTLFRLLEQLQVGVCLERLTTEPASLSLLTSFPLAYAAVDPALVQATEPRTHLTTVVEAAHAQHVPVIASGVDDEETLAGVRQSGVDFAAGSFIQPPSINMDFTFEPREEEA